MTGVSCLYRRPSGIYAVRLVVPTRLRPSLGRGEIHVSTGLRDWTAAKIVALRIQTHWRERFMTLDLEKLTTANPLLQGDGLISLSEAARIIGLSEVGLIGELLNDRASLFTHAQQWQGWHVDDLDVIETEPNGGFVLNSVEAHGRHLTHSGIVRSAESSAALASLLADGKATVSTFYLSGNAAFFSDAEIVIPLSAWMVRKTAIEHIRETLARGVATRVEKPSPPSDKFRVAHVVSPSSHPKRSGKRFSDLFDLYSAHHHWTPSHARRMATEASMFTELLDNPLLDVLDVVDVHRYAELLSKLPRDVYQARRKYPSARLFDLIAIAQRDSLPLKTKKTVRDHVARLGQVFNYGVSPAGMMGFNPAAKFKRKWGNANKRSGQHDREKFTAKELEMIFSQDWFANGTGNFTEKGATYWRPHYFWLPVLALTTGARLNELSQLYLDDIRQSDKNKSVWYLDFNLDQPDKADLDDDDSPSLDKSLKTVSSERVIPLHDLVVRAGLPEYVAALRKAGEERLFPELKRDANKGYGKPAGSWFNERLLGEKLGMKRNGKKTFHSFRHTFATMVERLDITERVLAQLLGHSRGDSQGMSRYAKDRDAASLKSIVDRLEFPALDGLGHFDPAAALKAIKWAKRLKQAVARSKT